MPNVGWPVTMARLSTPVFALPMMVKSAAGLSGTDAMSGAVIFAAVAASWPYVIDRLLARWRTEPDAAEHSFAGPPHVCAAAATNIRRTDAPTRLSGS